MKKLFNNITIALRQNRNIAMSYIAMLMLLVVVSILRPGFGLGDPNHLRALVMEAAVIGLAAMGQTMVMISGGADLSVPWTVTGAAIMLTIFTQGRNEAMIWAIPIVLVGCMVVGFLNGLGVAILGVSPLIVTLAMNYILLGLIAGIGMGGVGTMGRYGQPPAFFLVLARQNIGGIPYFIIAWLLLSLVVTIVLAYSSFGRRLYAIGSNQTVSLYSGVNLRATLIMAYVLCSLLNGIAGMLIAGKFGRAYLGMGDPYLFVSISAVVIGGAAITGGSGNYLGTISGAMFLSILISLLPVLNMPRSFQLIIYGLVVILAVLFSESNLIGRLNLRRKEVKET